MNPSNSVIYIGITNDLVRRTYEHNNHLIKGFSAKYNVTKLVYYEVFNNINDAIHREKQLKGGSREQKLKLIESLNPEFSDLYKSLL